MINLIATVMVTDEDVSPHLLPLIEGATDHCLTAPVNASQVTQEPADHARNVHLPIVIDA